MSQSVYRRLAERIDMNVTGAPKKGNDYSPAFLKYLEMQFTPEEAEIASFLSVNPNWLKAEVVADRSGRPVQEIEQTLTQLAERGVIIGFDGSFVLPPPQLVFNAPEIRGNLKGIRRVAAGLYKDAESAEIDEGRCMGCGVCTVTCPTEALHLERLEREPIFDTSAEMCVRVAAENEAAGQKRPLE